MGKCQNAAPEGPVRRRHGPRLEAGVTAELVARPRLGMTQRSGLVPRRPHLLQGGVDRVEAAGRATEADDVALEPPIGRVEVALDGDAVGGLAADVGGEFRRVVAALVAN